MCDSDKMDCAQHSSGAVTDPHGNGAHRSYPLQPEQWRCGLQYRQLALSYVLRIKLQERYRRRHAYCSSYFSSRPQKYPHLSEQWLRTNGTDGASLAAKNAT